MAGWKNPGPLNSVAAPMNLVDGTLALTPGAPPGILHISFSWPFQEEIRRTGYVKDALARAASKYSVPAIIQHTTKDFLQIIEGVVQGLLIAFAGLIVTVAVGAIIGGAIGSLAGGVGAAPGAVAGADIGLTVGEGILAWLGLGFLAIFLASLGGQVKLMGQEIEDGVRTAWNSRGELSAIDLEDQLPLHTGEVDDVRANRHLSPKVHPEEVAPEIPPETALGIGHPPAQFAGSGCGLHPESLIFTIRREI